MGAEPVQSRESKVYAEQPGQSRSALTKVSGSSEVRQGVSWPQEASKGAECGSPVDCRILLERTSVPQDPGASLGGEVLPLRGRSLEVHPTVAKTFQSQQKSKTLEGTDSHAFFCPHRRDIQRPPVSGLVYTTKTGRVRPVSTFKAQVVLW